MFSPGIEPRNGFYKLKNFSLSPGIEPRIFILRVPLLYHSSTVAQFNIGIRCKYERCVRGFWRQILVYTLLTFLPPVESGF